MQNVETCQEHKPSCGNYGLVIVVVLYILLAIILGSFRTC